MEENIIKIKEDPEKKQTWFPIRPNDYDLLMTHEERVRYLEVMMEAVVTKLGEIQMEITTKVSRDDT